MEGDSEGIYEKGSMVDHMLTHFQCDLCHLQNMKGRDLTEEGRHILEINNCHKASVTRRILDQKTGGGKGEFDHDEEDGNNG